MTHKLSIIALTLVILIATNTAFAKPVLNDKDKQHLLTYLNSYNTQQFINDPLIKTQLKKLLGSELNHLKKNLDVHIVIGLSHGMIFVYGNAIHQGNSENGFLGINLYDGTVSAGLLTEGKIKVFCKR